MPETSTITRPRVRLADGLKLSSFLEKRAEVFMETDGVDRVLSANSRPSCWSVVRLDVGRDIASDLAVVGAAAGEIVLVKEEGWDECEVDAIHGMKGIRLFDFTSRLPRYIGAQTVCLSTLGVETTEAFAEAVYSAALRFLEETSVIA